MSLNDSNLGQDSGVFESAQSSDDEEGEGVRHGTPAFSMNE